VQKAIDELGELGVIKPQFNSSLKSSSEEANSRFDAQIKAEDKYRDSVYAVIDAMGFEVAGEFTSK
jgi:hypothetical protein